MTALEHVQAMLEIFKDYPESINYPVVYDKGDEHEVFGKLVFAPTIGKFVEDTDSEKYEEVHGSYDALCNGALSVKECNVICVN